MGNPRQALGRDVCARWGRGGEHHLLPTPSSSPAVVLTSGSPTSRPTTSVESPPGGLPVPSFSVVGPRFSAASVRLWRNHLRQTEHSELVRTGGLGWWPTACPRGMPVSPDRPSVSSNVLLDSRPGAPGPLWLKALCAPGRDLLMTDWNPGARTWTCPSAHLGRHYLGLPGGSGRSWGQSHRPGDARY